MFYRRRFPSIPLVAGAVMEGSEVVMEFGEGNGMTFFNQLPISKSNPSKVRKIPRPQLAIKHTIRIGVISGKALFGPPLEEYWKKRLEEEAAMPASKESDAKPQ